MVRIRLRRVGLKKQPSYRIVVAYREHEGDRFPIFTKFDIHKGFLCHPDEASSRYIVGGVIPNNWERTVEM